MEGDVDADVVDRARPDGFDVFHHRAVEAGIAIKQFDAGHPNLENRLRGVDDELVASFDCLGGVGFKPRTEGFAVLGDDHLLFDRRCRFDPCFVDVAALAAPNRHVAPGLSTS